MTSLRNRIRPPSPVDRFIATSVACAIAVVGTLVALEIKLSSGQVDWPLFGLFAALLFVTEHEPRSWLRLREDGVVTLGWTFAFALLLLGSPTVAVVTMALTTVTSEIRNKNDARKIIFNTAQVSMALGLGGITLYAFGVDGPIVTQATIPITWGLGVLASGLVVFVFNGALVCLLLSVVHQTSFARLMREGFALSIIADGALLALAPIFVISVHFSWVMIPFLSVAALLVYRSARHSIAHEHDARHDALTGLANRRAFVRDTDDSLHADGKAACGVMLIDLDGFKSVNDRLGHEVGDAVLVEFARRLEKAFPTARVIARLGGDEFALLVEDAHRSFAADALAVAQRDLTAPMAMDDFVVTVGASMGVALHPADGTTSSELLHTADLAMYRAKHFGSALAIDLPTPGNESRNRRRLLSELEGIKNRNELFLEYQPIVAFSSGSVSDLEALVRWNHPELGVLWPSDFIGLEDHNHAIRAITTFMIEQATSDLVELGDHSVSIAVDIPPRVLRSESFVNEFVHLLRGNQIDPRRLIIEIPESALMYDSIDLVRVLERIRRNGVRIAIDNFGAAGKSLSILAMLEVDRIKLDPTLVRTAASNHRAALVIDGMIDLAHRLDIEVVADGVDDAHTWNALHAMGCDFAQGDHIASPNSIVEAMHPRLNPGRDLPSLDAVVQ